MLACNRFCLDFGDIGVMVELRRGSCSEILGRWGGAECITQKEVAGTAPNVGQSAPSCASWRERVTHHKTEPSVAILAASNLRGEGQKLLVHQPPCVEFPEQSGASFDEDPFADIHTTDRIEDRARRDLTATARNGADLERSRRLSLEQTLCARRCCHHERLHATRCEHRQMQIDLATAADDDV